jgi:hypothetical protein
MDAPGVGWNRIRNDAHLCLVQKSATNSKDKYGSHGQECLGSGWLRLIFGSSSVPSDFPSLLICIDLY